MKLANSKDKEKILKAARYKKSLTFMGRSISTTADLSTETWQARNSWQDILSVLNEKNMQPRILYPARLSFKTEGEIKSFQDRQKARVCDHEAISARNTKVEYVIDEFQGNNPQQQGLNRYHDDTKSISLNCNSKREWA